ncbi:AraC family transcriptional regulator [Aquimarina sp. ERC-38]|uniref:AraC family transcriptional regulator n=1 Tax=Aquimarina sp. ERC-38 TaxID=2949996 RepID=UPI0022480398|nr:AraC family transcriptional regulator [Aquimarina sp. ERC-38]UZO80943.1 AraC family transcriptional regulator [Aquimarina sp. ERC-38]
MKIIKEITPLNLTAPFVLQRHENAQFDYPLHYHSEYEINYITNFYGKRIAGDSIERCDTEELALLGPGLQHIWTSDTPETNATVITLQFSEGFLGNIDKEYRIFHKIKELLNLSKKGIHFSKPTRDKVGKKLEKLVTLEDLPSFFLFIEILQDLAVSKDKYILSSSVPKGSSQQVKSRRINKVIQHIYDHYQKDLKLDDLAHIANMSPSAFSHFFKKRTNINFTQFLLNYRLSMASKLLVETELAINEISFKVGFKTLSNFNRSFKRKYNVSPRQFKRVFEKI